MKLILQIIHVVSSLLFVNCSPNRPPGTKISSYENYLEDMSEIGKVINCTDAEKECYTLNRVLHTDGKCYMLGEISACTDSKFFFNKEKAANGEYKAVCQPDKCESPRHNYMAFDQTCYRDTLIEDVCDSNRNLSYGTNVFGEGHCRCAGAACSRPEVTQPEDPGRCHLPDLMKASFVFFRDPLVGRDIPCLAEEQNCYEQGKMLHSDGSCHKILEQGPCLSGEWFVANKTEFDQRGWLAGACTPSNCGQNNEEPGKIVRMQSDGKCYKLEDVKQKLCPPRKAVFDVFGNVGCGYEEDADVGLQLPFIVSQTGVCRSRTGLL